MLRQGAGLWPMVLGLALLLGGTLVLRIAMNRHRPSREELLRLVTPALLVSSVLVLTLAMDDARYLLFVPALINGALLVAFARTLRAGPSLVETFARLQHPDLSAAQVRHCRAFTGVWSAFFLVNGGISLWLALQTDLWRWTLYTGLIAYLLMGVVFATEFVVRSWRFRNYQGSLFEPLFRRLFPRGPVR